MACYEYKVTVEYVRPLAWDVSIFRRSVDLGERGPWSRILCMESVPTLEGHMDPTARIRQVMRSLA